MLSFVEFQPPKPGQKLFNATVGARPPAGAAVGQAGGAGYGGGATDTLQLTTSDKIIDVSVFFDGHFAEIFFCGGRVALTVAVRASKLAGLTVLAAAAPAPVEVVGVEAWHMGSIWIPKEEVQYGRR